MRRQKALQVLTAGFIGAILAVGAPTAGLHASDVEYGEPETLSGIGDSQVSLPAEDMDYETVPGTGDSRDSLPAEDMDYAAVPATGDSQPALPAEDMDYETVPAIGDSQELLPTSDVAPVAPVTLPGTGDSQDLLHALAQDYTAQYPDRTVMVPASIGSDGGVRVVGTGEYPVGRVARKPTPEEITKFGEFMYVEFARVPVAFVVSPEAGMSNLTEEQICDIFAGRVTNWQDVGGNDLPIDVQARPEDGSNMRTIRQHMACFANLEITPNAHDNLRNGDLVASMKTFAGAIGFMPLAEAELHGYQVVTVDGIAPSMPQYKFGIGLGFVHKESFSPSIQAFLDYLKTEAAREIMRKTGHVPVEG